MCITNFDMHESSVIFGFSKNGKKPNMNGNLCDDLKKDWMA